VTLVHYGHPSYTVIKKTGLLTVAKSVKKFNLSLRRLLEELESLDDLND